MHWHKFDRGHTQTRQILDDRRGSQTGVRPAKGRGNIGMAHGESSDVEFIDDGFVPWNAGWPVRSPGESGIDHAILRHPGSIVAPVKRQVLLPMPHPISKMGVAPMDGPLNLLAIRIQKKFMVIETMTLLGSIRARYPVSV